MDTAKSNATPFAEQEATESGRAKISVVIPAYNAAHTIAETLDSICAQSLPATEIIVVDDGSTDGTASVVGRYAPLVTLMRQENQGLASARNKGCQAAKCDLIAFIDADDVAHPDRLALQIACFQTDPGIVLSYSDFSAFGETGVISTSYIGTYYPAIGRTAATRSRLLGEPHTLVERSANRERIKTDVQCYVGRLYSHLVHDMYIHPPSIMFRRDLFDLNGPFDISLKNLCDWEWLIRASRHGAFAFVDFPLIAYRLHSAQMSRRSLECQLDSIAITRRVMERDPETARHDSRRFKQDLGNYQLGAAEATRYVSKFDALKLLLSSIPNRGIDRRTLSIFAKAAIPNTLIAWLAPFT